VALINEDHAVLRSHSLVVIESDTKNILAV